MTNQSNRLLVLGAGLVASVGLYAGGREMGKEDERNMILQDLHSHQYGLLHDAMLAPATTVQRRDTLLERAGSVEYILNRLERGKK